MTTSAEACKNVSPYHLPTTSGAQTCTDVTPHRRQGWDMQKRKSFLHCEYNSLSAENVRDRRAQPLTELSLSERSEDSAANRALRARIKRKLEAYKQEATQLPRLNCLGRRESVLSTYGISLTAQIK